MRGQVTRRLLRTRFPEPLEMIDATLLSDGRPGTCWDNAVAESFFATLKNELIYLHVWPTRQSARSAIFTFIEGWYNRVRLHSTLTYSSPQMYEEDYYRLCKAA